jgi:hypothetical protein
MSRRLDLFTPCPATEFLDRLRARGREWRESTVPEGLRKAGVFGIRVEIDGWRFKMWCESGARSSYVPVCVGMVTRAGGQTRVHAYLRPSGGSMAALGLWVAWITVLSVWAGSLFFWLFGLALAGGMWPIMYASMAPWHDGLLALVREAAGPDARAVAGSEEGDRSSPRRPTSG